MLKEFIATGRRKRAIACVRLRPGAGKLQVNGRSLEEYFPLELQRKTVLAPFERMGGHQRYDMIIRLIGGGLEGQAVAARLGIARALVEENQELRQAFKECGFLTRDARKRERKKYGLAGARKRFQFSKR